MRASVICSLVSIGNNLISQFCFAKITVAYVDVLGPRVKFGKPCQFEGT